eukprot:2714866-Rhodomonas_salina.1
MAVACCGQWNALLLAVGLAVTACRFPGRLGVRVEPGQRLGTVNSMWDLNVGLPNLGLRIGELGPNCTSNGGERVCIRVYSTVVRPRPTKIQARAEYCARKHVTGWEPTAASTRYLVVVGT